MTSPSMSEYKPVRMINTRTEAGLKTLQEMIKSAATEQFCEAVLRHTAALC